MAMNPTITASWLVTAAVLIEACSEMDHPDIGPVAVEEKPSYLCSTEASAGFTFRGEWRPVEIATNRIYLITPGIPDALDRESDDNYLIYEDGRVPPRPCQEKITKTASAAVTENRVMIRCRILAKSSLAPDFTFDATGVTPAGRTSPTTRTFLRLFLGYTYGKDDDPETPYMEVAEIGTCTRLSERIVVGNCATGTGSTIITTMESCDELGGQFESSD